MVLQILEMMVEMREVLRAGPLDVERATKPSCGTLETAGLKR